MDVSSCYPETGKATYPQEQVLFEKGIDLKGILATAYMRVNLFHTEVECKNLTVKTPAESLTQPLQIRGRQTTDICASNIIGVQLLSSLQERPKEVEVEAAIGSSDR